MAYDCAELWKLVNHASVIVDQWNRQADSALASQKKTGRQRHAPREWVEEFLVHRHLWHKLARERNPIAIEHYERAKEFEKRLPRALIETILQHLEKMLR